MPMGIFAASISKKCSIFFVYAEEYNPNDKRSDIMKHIQTLRTRDLAASVKHGGCGECQTSCQSACKTSCGVANQQCENK